MEGYSQIVATKHSKQAIDKLSAFGAAYHREHDEAFHALLTYLVLYALPVHAAGTAVEAPALKKSGATIDKLGSALGSKASSFGDGESFEAQLSNEMRIEHLPLGQVAVDKHTLPFYQRVHVHHGVPPRALPLALNCNDMYLSSFISGV